MAHFQTARMQFTGLSSASNRLRRPAVLVLLTLAMGSVTFLFGVSQAEEHDAFCISCHTRPEQTYYDRAQSAARGEVPYLDLASAHYGLSDDGFRCIDCHRGNGGLRHRAVTLTLGARDALIFFSGQADPAIEKGKPVLPQLGDAACVRCHRKTLLVAGFENHFHNKLPAAFAAWQAGNALTAPEGASETGAPALQRYDTTLACADCHRAHVHLEGAETQAFLDIENVVFPACVKCHEEVGAGPLELGP